MRLISIILILVSCGCYAPIRIVETYVTDSLTGKTTKVIEKFYDSTDDDRRSYYQQDYMNFMLRPYMYYDPFFYDPFWNSRAFYYAPRVVVPNPPRGAVPAPAPRPSSPRILPPGPRPKPDNTEKK